MKKAKENLIADAHEFIRLKAEYNLHKAKAAALKVKLDAMEPGLVERFEEDGVDQMKIHGATLFIREEFWPALVEMPGVEPDQVRLAAVKLLIKMGHWKQVSFNHQSMRTIVKELESEDGTGELDGPLGKYIRCSHVYRLSARGVGAADDSTEE